MDIRQRLAGNLRRLRDERKWSQEELAAEANLHRTYISDIERCARNPTILVIEKIASAFSVTAGVLLD